MAYDTLLFLNNFVCILAIMITVYLALSAFLLSLMYYNSCMSNSNFMLVSNSCLYVSGYTTLAHYGTVYIYKRTRYVRLCKHL